MMTRRIKLDEGSPVYHCIGRIVGGELVLGNEEKEHFRKLMWRLAEFSGVEIITYCVMSNHVHLLLRVPGGESIPDEEICRRVVKYYGRREPWVQVLLEGMKRAGSLGTLQRKRLLARMGDVSVFMRTLKQRFSRWYNRKHQRFGTLWAERFKSLVVEDSVAALRTVAMYIDLNPVRAGIVKDPKDYRFCGHAEAVVGQARLRAEISKLGAAKGWRAVAAAYRQEMLVSAGREVPGKASLSRHQITKVLRNGGALETGEVLRLRLRYLSDGVAFGSAEFVEWVFQRFRDRFGPRRKSGARKLHGVPGSLDGFTTARDLRKDAIG